MPKYHKRICQKEKTQEIRWKNVKGPEGYPQEIHAEGPKENLQENSPKKNAEIPKGNPQEIHQKNAEGPEGNPQENLQKKPPSKYQKEIHKKFTRNSP